MIANSKVFISYSHDSGDHRKFVLALANQLRGDGLDCRIDQHVNGFPPEGWQRWMETQIEQADFVLIVCTPQYLQRYRGLDEQGGRGVNFEGVVISQTLYDHYYCNTKFIPIIPEQGSFKDVPLPLKGYTVYALPRDYTRLYRLLTGQHDSPAPAIGTRVTLQTFQPAENKAAKPEKTETTTVRHKTPVSDTIKAAYIGAAAVLLAAIVAGLFTFLSGTEYTTQGDCSSILTGDINSSVALNCTSED